MTTTDTEVMNHFPTAAALICAVHDRDIDTVHTMLRKLTGNDLRSIAVLLADMVPDDRRPTELLDRTPRDSQGVPLRREDWTEQELREAHTAWTSRRERTPWAEVGEREYQRRRGARRKARARLDKQVLAMRGGAA